MSGWDLPAVMASISRQIGASLIVALYHLLSPSFPTNNSPPSLPPSFTQRIHIKHFPFMYFFSSCFFFFFFFFSCFSFFSSSCFSCFCF